MRALINWHVAIVFVVGLALPFAFISLWYLAPLNRPGLFVLQFVRFWVSTTLRASVSSKLINLEKRNHNKHT